MLICACAPVSGIGGGGQVDTTVSSKSNTALVSCPHQSGRDAQQPTHVSRLSVSPQYACFAGLSFFAGSIHNLLGTRLCLFIGACGYSLYVRIS